MPFGGNALRMECNPLLGACGQSNKSNSECSPEMSPKKSNWTCIKGPLSAAVRKIELDGTADSALLATGVNLNGPKRLHVRLGCCFLCVQQTVPFE
jgi:hypothetical protein